MAWLIVILIGALGATLAAMSSAAAADGSAYAHSDSDARFLHHIDLYDANNRKITPESTTPYSTVNTCGRCHDYDTISHGWHFNAFAPESQSGRQGEPWIWTDPRTGTQLPLSYRQWNHTFHPNDLGITPWQMTEKFGGRIPGGSMAASPDKNPPDKNPSTEPDAASGTAPGTAPGDSLPPSPRWQLSGGLDIDCMICHAQSGAYDFNERREQIDEQNFAWAATAALRLGTVDGKVSRIKDGADPSDQAIQDKLPKVKYDDRRFNADGSVFMDLVREPTSNACYQCHSTRTVDKDGIQPRWVHDEDVHLRAGMVCADCHRNGIDHHIVRGFEGEQNPSGKVVQTLSCAGCHLGAENQRSHGGENAGNNKIDGLPNSPDPNSHDVVQSITMRAGRLGSPQPMHAGLPPVHFEKLACTACHSGPAPREKTLRIMTSLAHGLGDKGHRNGFELPTIQGPIYGLGSDGKIQPQKTVWPAYWATVTDGVAKPISPETVYQLTRKTLRVRKDFVAELVMPKPSSSDLKKVLGEDRSRTPQAEWTDDERNEIEAMQKAKGSDLFAEKVSAALETLESELKAEQVVYVSAGIVYARGDKPKTLQTITLKSNDNIDAVSWPMAHHVRPAGWSLGVTGCTECHSESGKIFASTVKPIGPGPDTGEEITMASLRGVDENQRLAWNTLFSGRKSFKYVIVTSLALLILTLLVGAGAIGARVADRVKKSPSNESQA